MISTLAVGNYRSLRRLVVPLTRPIGVVTHARPIADALRKGAIRHRLDVNSTELVKEFGQTTVVDREGPLDEPVWHWPKR